MFSTDTIFPQNIWIHSGWIHRCGVHGYGGSSVFAAGKKLIKRTFMGEVFQAEGSARTRALRSKQTRGRWETARRPAGWDWVSKNSFSFQSCTTSGLFQQEDHQLIHVHDLLPPETRAKFALNSYFDAKNKMAEVMHLKFFLNLNTRNIQNRDKVSMIKTGRENVVNSSSLVLHP
jgi:hypothetical protein